MPTVLITPEQLFDRQAPCARLLEEAGFDVRYATDGRIARGVSSEEETISSLRGIAAVLAGGEFVTEKVISSLPDLRVVARVGVGYDRVDVEAATERRVAVTITPTANHECVAEHALALLFAVARSIALRDRQVREGIWCRDMLEPLRSKTLGILGLGRIGRSLAVRARALGMTVVASEPNPDAAFVRDNEIEVVDFDRLLTRSDYLSLHLPLSQSTRGLMNRDAFAKMKRGSVLVNTSRGGLVVESDLVEVLRSGHLMGAGLDVFEEEPTPTENPLLRLDNVVLSPHVGGVDWLSIQNMGIEAARNVIQLHRGEWPEGAVVNETLREEWSW